MIISTDTEREFDKTQHVDDKKKKFSKLIE